jgi:hypothetical protein
MSSRLWALGIWCYVVYGMVTSVSEECITPFFAVFLGHIVKIHGYCTRNALGNHSIIGCIFGWWTVIHPFSGTTACYQAKASHCEAPRSCGRTPWMSDQLAARWPSHTLHKFLTIPNPSTRLFWQLDQQGHLAAKQGIGQETWPFSFAYRACLHSWGSFTCHESKTWDGCFTSSPKEGMLKDF